MTSRTLTAAIVALQFGWAGSALASNDNFRISNLREADTSDQALYIYRTFSRELGTALSHKYTFAGDSVGLYGLDIGLEANNIYVNTDRDCPTDEELGLNQDGRPIISTCYEGANGVGSTNEWDPWRVVDTDHRLSGGKLLPVPGIRVRKGLPLSLEVGSAMYILPWSSQAALQGFGRWAIHEGFDTGSLRAIPDVALTVSGTRLVGNPEFDMSVLDWGFTFGWTIPAGGVVKSHVGDFSLFGGFGQSIITSVPADDLGHIDYDTSDAEVDPLQCLSGWTGRRANEEDWDKADATGCEGRAVYYDPSFRPYKGTFGLRVHNGNFQVGWTMEFVKLGLPSMTFRMGVMF